VSVFFGGGGGNRDGGLVVDFFIGNSSIAFRAQSLIFNCDCTAENALMQLCKIWKRNKIARKKGYVTRSELGHLYFFFNDFDSFLVMISGPTDSLCTSLQVLGLVILTKING